MSPRGNGEARLGTRRLARRRSRPKAQPATDGGLFVFPRAQHRAPSIKVAHIESWPRPFRPSLVFLTGFGSLSIHAPINFFDSEVLLRGRFKDRPATMTTSTAAIPSLRLRVIRGFPGFGNQTLASCSHRRGRFQSSYECAFSCISQPLGMGDPLAMELEPCQEKSQPKYRRSCCCP